MNDNFNATIQESEDNRWFQAVLDTEKKLDSKINCIHLMDREGDIYTQLCKMKEYNYKFVIRASNTRSLAETTYSKSFEALRGRIFH